MKFRSLHFFKAAALDEGVLLSAFLTEAAYQKSMETSRIPVRVYRRQTESIFGKGYLECFDGLMPDAADLLFEGDAPLLGRKLHYTDTTAEIGAVYAYWIEGLEGEGGLCGPAVVKRRDRAVWWPRALLLERLTALATAGGERVRLFSTGRTVRGTEIPGVIVGNSERCVALVGLIHPGEAGPELIVPVLERLVREDESLLEHVGVMALPSVNIDERERAVLGYPAYLRRNGNQVDLNRNFPAGWEEVSSMYGLDSSDPDALTYRGPAAMSEPETQAVMRAMEEAKPIAVFSFHCLAGICSPRFLTTALADEAYLERCADIAEPYWRGYYGPEKTKTEVIARACTAGSLPQWIYERFRVPAFDLEWDGDAATQACITDGTTREMLRDVAEKHYSGLRALLMYFERARVGRV